MNEYILESIKEGISLRTELLNNNQMISEIETIGNLVSETLKKGNKVLLCGNGGSAADAQHIAAELVGRFVTERRGLPAIALTTDTSILTAVSNDYGFEQIYERQVEALGQKGDLLIGISTSGNSANILKALQKAQSIGITTIGLLGGKGGLCKPFCDYSLVVNSFEAARIQEIHITIGHILCGMVDNNFGHA